MSLLLGWELLVPMSPWYALMDPVDEPSCVPWQWHWQKSGCTNHKSTGRVTVVSSHLAWTRAHWCTGLGCGPCCTLEGRGKRWLQVWTGLLGPLKAQPNDVLDAESSGQAKWSHGEKRNELPILLYNSISHGDEAAQHILMNNKGQLPQSSGMSQTASLPASHSLLPTLPPLFLDPQEGRGGWWIFMSVSGR